MEAIKAGRFATRLDLIGLLSRASTIFSARPAVVELAADRTCSYEDLAALSSAVAAELMRRGIGLGGRVALIGPAGIDWIAGFFGAVKAGACVIPLDTRLGSADMERVLADCRPDAVLSGLPSDCPAPGASMLRFHEFAALPAADSTGLVRERDTDDPTIIAYTSGSSGAPRGVMLSLQTVMFEVESLRDAFGTGSGDVFLSVLPPNHMLELVGGWLGPLFSGASIVVCPSLLPTDIAAAMHMARPSIMVAVPLLLRSLRNAMQRNPAFKLPQSLRFLVCGGAPLDAPTEEWFESTGVPVMQGYGLTETGPVVSVNRPESRRAGSVGRPLPEVEVRIDQGRILTRGPHLMSGYLHDAAPALDPHGWFDTGDLGHLEDGYLHVTGRAKSLIVLGSGKKVQPEELELALEDLGGIAEVCITGATHRSGPLAGTEEVCAVVVTALEAGQAREAIHARLAAFAPHKLPTRVVIHAGPLPRTAARKLKRDEIQHWLNREEP